MGKRQGQYWNDWFSNHTSTPTTSTTYTPTTGTSALPDWDWAKMGQDIKSWFDSGQRANNWYDTGYDFAPMPNQGMAGNLIRAYGPDLGSSGYKTFTLYDDPIKTAQKLYSGAPWGRDVWAGLYGPDAVTNETTTGESTTTNTSTGTSTSTGTTSDNSWNIGGWPINEDNTPIDTGLVDWTSVLPDNFGSWIDNWTTTHLPPNPYYSSQENAINEGYASGQQILDQLLDTINSGAFDADAYRRNTKDMISRNAKSAANSIMGRLGERGQVNSTIGRDYMSGNVGNYLADALQKMEMDVLDKQMADRGVNLQSLAQAGALTNSYDQNRLSGYQNLANTWGNDYQNAVTNTQNMLNMLDQYRTTELARELDLSKFLADYVAADEVD